MTGESGGKLTMTPSAGSSTIIGGGLADTFTGGIKRRSAQTGNTDSLKLADAFEIHGLFDLSSLPIAGGQHFGIRATDRAGSFNPGNDAMQLGVAIDSSSGDLVVFLQALDFIALTSELVDASSIAATISGGAAEQIELIISKLAGTADIGARFNIYGAGGLLGGNVLQTEALSTFSAAKNANLALYDGESYTRAQFQATDRIAVPEPIAAALLILGLALTGFGHNHACAAENTVTGESGDHAGYGGGCN